MKWKCSLYLTTSSSARRVKKRRGSSPRRTWPNSSTTLPPMISSLPISFAHRLRNGLTRSASKSPKSSRIEYFWVEDEDGDATVEVTDIVPIGDPEIIEINEEEASMQYTFDVNYTAYLSYKDNVIYSEGVLPTTRSARKRSNGRTRYQSK